jgi:hypothetical protein
MKNDLNARFGLMNPADKTNFFKEQRESLMSDIDDEDVRQSIAQNFNKYKAAN